MGAGFFGFHLYDPISAEHLAATAATGGQHTTAVLGGHTGTETMHLAALTLFGLISTEHCETLLLS